ncbi:hypothetical protein GHT06_010631 [Daphnia sinensis]|uniref:CUB domain-containing protein n=1 Tax=Daphnia sinensis TaxID=1820382 RepID=A0AAD5PZA5_9CRUS|nr:hypothetical protein GHT06_010631 [Daphnia sinensis]
MDLTLIIFLVLANRDVWTSPIGFIGWPQDAINTGTGSIWHVFRQVHASEVASRQFLSSSRTPSAKVAETTRIIPKEERSRSYEPSFTIISRIKSPMEQMLALIPPRPSWTPGFLGRRTEAISTRKEESSSRTSSSNGLAPWSSSSSHNASNLLIIGEAEPVVDDQRHVETSRKSDGLFTVEKGMVRYRGSQRGEDLNGNGHYPAESPSTFGLWEMLKLRRPQKWEALNKLLPSQSTTEREPAIEPTTTSTTPFSWNTEQPKNESHHWLENVDSLTLTEINSRTEEASTIILPTTTASATINSQEQPDATTITNRDASQAEDSGSIPTASPSPIASHPLNSSWLVVRIDESTCYAATDSFNNNGTIVFKRFQTNGANQSGWSDLSDIEAYYPGFGQVAVTKPAQLIVFTTIMASHVDETSFQQQEYATTEPVQTDTMGETVPIVTSTSSPIETETMAFHANQNDSVTVVDDEEDVKQEAANIVPHQLQWLSPEFRKVDDDQSAVNSVDEPNLDNEAADAAMKFAVSALVNNVTDVPTSSTEEQMTPPLLKTLENLLLTHLLPPISSSSSISSSLSSSPANFNVTSPSMSSSTTVRTVFDFTSASPSTSTSSSTTPTSTSATTSTSTESYFSWLLQHAASAEPIQSINDWSFASQLIEPARMSSTDPASHSTTVLPEEIIQPPVHYDPAINAGTLSSHSMIIPARNPSIVQPLSSRKPISERIVTSDQFSLKTVTDKLAVSQSSMTIASPIQMFTLKPEVEAPKIVTNKPASKKNTGLASLILAHTSALMSGKNSPFFNGNRRSSNSSDNRQTKRNFLPEAAPVTASVHVIVASPYPDAEQEEQLRQRSLDSRVRNNNKNAIKTGNSSWAFPSFSQLIESPELLLSGVPSSNSSIIRAAAPISSFNGNTNDDLPSLPRFSCGGQSSSDELVLTNPNYPNPDDDAGNCGFRLIVNSNHVCQVRVEFRDGRMLLPRKGNCVHQYLTVSQSTSGRVPSLVENKFCGFNSDQHFYVELTETGTNPRHVDFKVNTKAAGFPYRYSMIINQINCDLPSPDKAPTGCFQYFNSRSGVIKSFNFEGGQYWNNQNYRICIRSISDSCTLSLSSTEGDFGLQKAISRRVPANRAGVGIKACPRDYLSIPGTIRSEEKSQSGESNDRYCGSKFSDRPADFRHRVVMARMQNDVHIMTFRAGVPQHYNASHHGPGFRIDFEQINECPDLPINFNVKMNGTESAIVEEDDYYDEEATTVKDVVNLLNSKKSSE